MEKKKRKPGGGRKKKPAGEKKKLIQVLVKEKNYDKAKEAAARLARKYNSA